MSNAHEEFQFEVPAYSRQSVIKLLENYLDIRSTLIDRMPTPSSPLYSPKKNHEFREKPFGSTPAQPWPFMTKQVSPTRNDGKKRARMMEDLHCATLDLETALQTLSDEDYSLISDYYIIGGINIQELATSRGLASKGRMHERLQRIVMRLVRVMNDRGAYDER